MKGLSGLPMHRNTTFKPRITRITVAAWLAACAILLLIFYHPHNGQENKAGKSNKNIYDDAKNATLGFQKIFAINLKARGDRRDRMFLGAEMSGIHIDFIPAAEDVIHKSMPDGANPEWSMGFRGAWRSHMDVLQKIVAEDIATALILEDDLDWDVNIRDQMVQMSKAVHVLSHPGPSGTYLDPSWPVPDEKDLSQPVNLTLNEKVQKSKFSPYGDVWDLLWLGHCAAALPTHETVKYTKGKVVWHDDSVPEKKYIMYQDDGRLKDFHPEHTRVVHRTSQMVCIFAYAVTKDMARRILYHLGIKKMTSPLDFEFAQFCEGWWTKAMPHCYTAEPPYFSLFRPAGSKASHSDQTGLDGRQEKDFSPNLRFSAMQNLENFVEGRPLEDIAPDTKKKEDNDHTGEGKDGKKKEKDDKK